MVARVALAGSLSLACAEPPVESNSDSGTESGAETMTDDEVGSSESGDSGSESESDGSSTTSESDAGSESESDDAETESSTDTGSDMGSDMGSDTGGSLDELLTLDQVQVKGTHNSYHIEPFVALDSSHEYTHPPLDVQLEDFGVRAFEIDLHKTLLGDELVVYHISILDQVSTCDSLVDCLATIAGWSDANPQHLPIMVWFEIKDSTGGSPIDDLDLVDEAILSVFDLDRLITPDFVRGDHETLRGAIEDDGWPTLGEVRGKLMFMILNGDHGAVVSYTAGFDNLDGRAMFVSTDAADFDRPYAAVSKINNPGSGDIALAHAARIIVASNTCAANQPESECFAELDDADATGPHHLMDDRLTPKDGDTYFLDLPDGNPAQCNPVTAPPECTSEAVEDLP